MCLKRHSQRPRRVVQPTSRKGPRALGWRWDDSSAPEQEPPGALAATLQEGIGLFNAGQYYRCHDVMEDLWNRSREPERTIVQGILQCSVGMYHLLNQNHNGAMMELGEGLNKLRRFGTQGSPLSDFEQGVSEVLEFLYNTQREHAACSGDFCVQLDGSDESYRLLGDFGAGEALYAIHIDGNSDVYLQFCPSKSQPVSTPPSGLLEAPPVRVRVPVLRLPGSHYDDWCR